MDSQTRVCERVSESPRSALLPLRQSEQSPLPSHPPASRTFREAWNSWLVWQNRIWLDTWFFEVFSLFLCVGCAIAVGGIARAFEGKPLPNLPHGFTINAIVSILTTVTKSNLLLIMASSLCQLKWIWYQQSRNLEDMQLFEDASRGPSGSLRMLLRHRFTSFASFGASILVLSVVLEPFVQQVLTYPSSTNYVDSSLVVTNQARTFLTDDLTIPFTLALEAGLWSDTFARTPSCPTADCRWETFSSIGLCSSCGKADMLPTIENCTLDFNYTYLVETPTGVLTTFCNITYRPGYSFQFPVNLTFGGYDSDPHNSSVITPFYNMLAPAYLVTDIYPRWDSMGDFASSDQNQSFQGVSNPFHVTGAAILEVHSGSIKVIHAETCALNFCLRDYDIKLEKGVLNETIVDIHDGSTFITKGPMDDWQYWCWSAHNQSFDYDQASRSTSGFVYVDKNHFSFCTLGWFRGWANIVGDRLAGYLSQERPIACPANTSSSCEDILEITSELQGYGYDGPNTNLLLHMYSLGLTTMMAQVAASLTRLAIDSNSTTVSGQAGISQPHVRVRWAWFILPAALVVATITFLTFTILMTKKHRAPLWKCSVLTYLFHGLENDDIQAQVQGQSGMSVDPIAETASAMGMIAITTAVKLETSEHDGRLVFKRSAITKERTGTEHSE